MPSLRFTMEAPAGARDPVVTEDIGGTVVVDAAAHVRIWKLQVADPGDYSVTTEGDVGGFIDPQPTFGRESWMPAWPAAVFALVFVVALGLLVVGAMAAGRREQFVLPGPGGFVASPLRVSVHHDAEHQHPGAGVRPTRQAPAADRPAQGGHPVRRRVRSGQGPARVTPRA